MPAQDRLGGDEERRPTLPWHEPGQGGDERSVGPGEPGSCDLAAQDGQLVAEHQDLRILGDGVHPVDAQELDDATDQAVEEAERHGVAGSPSRSCLVKPTIGLLDPSGHIPRHAGWHCTRRHGYERCAADNRKDDHPECGLRVMLLFESQAP